jgi:hypothetical protein
LGLFDFLFYLCKEERISEQEKIELQPRCLSREGARVIWKVRLLALKQEKQWALNLHLAPTTPRV